MEVFASWKLLWKFRYTRTFIVLHSNQTPPFLTPPRLTIIVLRCLEIIASEPSDLQGHARLGAQCCVRLGRLDEAIDRLDVLIAAAPEDGTLLIERNAAAGQLCLLRAEAANEVLIYVFIIIMFQLHMS